MEGEGKKWLESEKEGVGRLLLAARDLLPGEVHAFLICSFPIDIDIFFCHVRW